MAKNNFKRKKKPGVVRRILPYFVIILVAAALIVAVILITSRKGNKDRQEIQTVVLCRIFAPEFSGGGFRFLIAEFKRFQVFFKKGFKVHSLQWLPVKGQVCSSLRKKGG